MKSLRQNLFVLLLVMIFSGKAFAVGTPATTSISNTVTVNYTVGAASLIASDSAVLTVQEYIDVSVTWQDAANVAVATPSTAQLLTYQLVNLGNGSEAFSLSVFNADVSDQFDPLNARIYLDDGNGIWDGVATETAYIPGTNDPVLDANGSDRIMVFVLNDIPSSLAIGDLGNSRLDIQARTIGAAGAASGTVLNGVGDDGVNAVVGASQAQAAVSSTYEVTSTGSIAVTLSKSSSVVSNLEGCSVAPCDPNPGATIRYSILVTVSGSGSAESLVIADPVPADTGYVSETITLDGTAKSDAADGDEAEITAGTISVNLGDVVSPATRIITFDVTIN